MNRKITVVLYTCKYKLRCQQMCSVTQFDIINYQRAIDDQKTKSEYCVQYKYLIITKANYELLKEIYELEFSNIALYFKRNCL